MAATSTTGASANMFDSADWYDRTINWSARLAREVPVLTEVFGSPGSGGIVDAGCGTGHQASALARRGYRVLGLDASEAMLTVARQSAAKDGAEVQWVRASYAEMRQAIGGGFDGVYCLANSLAAAGTCGGVKLAIEQFAGCLRPGGRLFVQVLNFERMRRESPCVHGPRVSVVDGREYVSVRQFHFTSDGAQVTNITIWSDKGWHQRAHTGQLYPVKLDEFTAWCRQADIRIDDVWGDYARTPFDIDRSVDLILVGTRA